MAQVGFEPKPCRSESLRFLPLDHAADNEISISFLSNWQKGLHFILKPKKDLFLFESQELNFHFTTHADKNDGNNHLNI